MVYKERVEVKRKAWEQVRGRERFNKRGDEMRRRDRRGGLYDVHPTHLISWILEPFLPITQPISCSAQKIQ